MSSAAVKELLEATLRAAQEREAELVALVDGAPSGTEGRWSAKDHIAHLSWWRTYATRLLTADSDEVYPGADDIDAQNARTYTANRDRSAADIVAEASGSYANLIAALRARSEAELLQPRHGRPGPAWNIVPPNGHVHVGQHLVQWHLETGDRDGAEQVALWARELDDRFDDDQVRALARYNLACFYAKVSDAARARPLLRESFGLNPSLREWARNDPDLASVRDNPEVARLLQAS